MKLPDAELARLHAWRKRVVRSWLVTMGAALLAWAAAAALELSAAVQAVLGVALIALVLASIVAMRAGRCPSCGEPIRFAPRIELPPRCSRCRADFHGS